MPELSISELTAACAGELLRGDPGVRVASFGIDTRALTPGSAFFALPGKHSDGHRFLAQAAERGASVAIVSVAPTEGEVGPAALIRVPDTVAALTACGRWVRRHLSGKRWLAVTGSNGKTTTKELIAAGLAAAGRVHRTPGNLNNHLGVPLSLLACPADAHFAVLEMGMSAPGEIAHLASIVDPDVGLVTNVRAAHLEGLGTLDDIAAAKGELYATLRDDATAVVNLDDVHARVQAARHVGPRVTFGQHAGADLRLDELHNRFEPGASFRFSYLARTFDVQLRLGGGHSAFNALAALAAIVAAGVDVEAAIPCLERVEAGPGRGRLHHLPHGVVVIDDTYNSSPSALAWVLETLRQSEPAGRRVLVMGDMLELGRMETPLHREAGKRAAAAGVHVLFAVGPLSRAAAESARRAGVPEVHTYGDSSEAAEAVRRSLGPGDLVVVKGSRGMRMERIVQALTAQHEEAC